MSELPENVPGNEAKEEIFQLVYVSAATVPFSLQDLEQLLEKAREKNASLGITGLLLFVDATFFQVLEGDKKQVESLYERIEQDERHTGKLILLKRTVYERTFAAWRMGFVSDEETIRQLPGFVDFFSAGYRSFLHLQGNDERIQEIMEGFRDGKWRRQAATEASPS